MSGSIPKSGDSDLSQVAEAKARAARLLLAFRHGNQLAYDAEIAAVEGARDGDADAVSDLVSALCWIANEGVRKAYLPEAGDQVLRHFARRTPYGERDVLTEEGAGPDAAQFLEAVAAGDVEVVRELVRTTPDTTFLLGKLTLALGMLLPDVPVGRLEEVLGALRRAAPANR